jgi:hypothetical protein
MHIESSRYNIKKIVEAVIVYTAVLCYVLIMMMCNYPEELNKCNMIMSMTISGYMIYATRKRTDLLILSLCVFYENYSIAVGCYLDPTLRPEWLYNQFGDGRVYTVASLSLLLFEITLFLGWRVFKDSVESRNISIDDFPDNSIIMCLCMILYTLIFVTQVDFSVNARATSNTINEYKFVLLIIGSIYSKNNKSNKILWTILVAVSSIATFFGGNRVNTLCNIFVLAVLWYNEYLTLKKVIIIAFPCIFIMLMIGQMRYQFSISFNTIADAWNLIKEDKLVADSFTFAFGPTIAAEEMHFVMSIDEKVRLLLNNIIYIVAGGSYGQYSLANYTSNYYMHYYGFLGANYFDLWFGPFGGMLAGIAVLKIVYLRAGTINRCSNFRKVVALGAFANLLRWYNYNFMQIFRTVFVMIIVLVIFQTIHAITTKSFGYRVK